MCTRPRLEPQEVHPLLPLKSLEGIDVSPKPPPAVLAALRPWLASEAFRWNASLEEDDYTGSIKAALRSIFGDDDDADLTDVIAQSKQYVIDTVVAWSRENDFCDEPNAALIFIFGEPNEDDLLYRDSDGWTCDGYDREGYDEDGYGRDRYNARGFDPNGYNKENRDVDGFYKYPPYINENGQTRVEWEQQIRQQAIDTVATMTPGHRAIVLVELQNAQNADEA